MKKELPKVRELSAVNKWRRRRERERGMGTPWYFVALLLTILTSSQVPICSFPKFLFFACRYLWFESGWSVTKLYRRSPKSIRVYIWLYLCCWLNTDLFKLTFHELIGSVSMCCTHWYFVALLEFEIRFRFIYWFWNLRGSISSWAWW